MARVTIPVQVIPGINEPAADALFANLTTAISATDGAQVDMSGSDDRILILIQNAATSAKTVTIKAGNGVAGVVDLEKSIAASSYTLLRVDSARFKNLSGADKGNLLITGDSADIKVAVFRLP